MCLPAAVSAGLWLAGPRLARRLPPATAVRLLTLASLLTALSTGFVLAVAAFLVLARVPAVALLGHWSATALAAMEPVPAAAGLAAGATVLTLLASAARRGAAAGRDLAVAAATCRRLGAAAGGLVVVDDTAPDAYAVPGLGGRVVVSTAMLRALPARGAARAAGPRGRAPAPPPPPVRPARRARRRRQPAAAPAGRRGARRCGAVGGRGGRRGGLRPACSWPGRWPAPASLAPQPRRAGRPTAPQVALGAVDSAVAERTRALLAPPPSRRRALAAAVVALMLLPVAAAAVTAGDTEHRVEMAQAGVGALALTARRMRERRRGAARAPAYRLVSACCRCGRGCSGRVGATPPGRAGRCRRGSS